MSYTYEYPRPSVTVDAVVFRELKGQTEILLIQRKHTPFKHGWALPGGFMDMDETVEEAVARELLEETNLTGLELKQLFTFSALDRDPRGRTLSVVFWGIMKNNQQANAGDDAQNAKWFSITKLPELAFDHREVINLATDKLSK